MLTAFILVKSTRDGLTRLGSELASVEGVAEVYTVTGEWDFVAIVRVREHDDLAKVVTQHLTRLEAIQRTQTMVAFQQFSAHDLEAMFGLGLEFAASRGKGATLNGERLPQLRAVEPSKAIVATGFPFRRKELMPRYRPVMEGALQRFEDLRRAGAAALDLAWTAAGTFDGYFELNLSTWDVAAGAALVLEVGGRVTDWSGGATWVEAGSGIFAAAPAVHEVLLELAAAPPQR